MRKSLLAFIPLLSACAGEPPQNIGVNGGRLSPCPDSPNCVSSFETGEEHGIAALDANLTQIQQILLGLDEANIVEQTDNYLYAEFTSRIMGFVDDVEFLDPCAIRIAARTERSGREPQAHRGNSRSALTF